MRFRTQYIVALIVAVAAASSSCKDRSGPDATATATLQPAAAAAIPAGPHPLSNADIIKLSQAGISDDVIATKIDQANETAFTLEVDDLQNLKKSGVSNPTIKAMLEKTAGADVAKAREQGGTSEDVPQLDNESASNANAPKKAKSKGTGGGSKFSRLKIGMSSRQVEDLIGPPTDQSHSMLAKAWIPFHSMFGDGDMKIEYHYKREGVLTFTGGGMKNMTSYKLTKIKVDSRESGYAK
jgi:hypothetical protein